MTARECALDLIRVYVQRGDSYDSIITGGMGRASREYDAQIGGIAIIGPPIYAEARSRTFNRHQIIVTEVAGVPCCEIFSAWKLYDELKRGVTAPSLWGAA